MFMKCNFKIAIVYVSTAFWVTLGFSSCGYFENDGLKKKAYVFANVAVARFGQSGTLDLVLDQGDGGFVVLEQNCKSLFYDSVIKKIFVELVSWDSSRTYHLIQFKQKAHDDYRMETVNKKEIERSEYTQATGSGLLSQFDLNVTRNE